ncbi:hypothetical protein Tco_0050480, partial [Tanacetum coccineum]
DANKDTVEEGEVQVSIADMEVTTAEPVTTASAPITTAGVSVSTTEPSTPPTTTNILDEEDLIIAQTLMKMRSKKSKEKGVERGLIMKEPSETATRPTVPPQKLDPKDKVQMQAELKEEARLARQREEEANVALIEEWDNVQAMMDADYKLSEEQRRKPLTKAQRRNQICTYLKNMARFTHSKLKSKSFDEVQKAFDKTMSWINLFVPIDSEVVKKSKDKAEGSKKRTKKGFDEESVKRQKLEDDAEKAEHRLCLR